MRETASPRRRHPEDTLSDIEDAGMMGFGGAADLTGLASSLFGCGQWLPLLRVAYLIDPWRSMKHNRRKVTLKDGLWYKGERIYVPMHHVLDDGQERNLRRDVLEALHGPSHIGHPGPTKILELVSRTWWWPGLYEDVKDFVAFCDSCQKVKASTQLPAGLLQPLQCCEPRWLHKPSVFGGLSA
jgi:hypothetical protein